MSKEKLFSVLKCSSNPDLYIFSNIIVNSYDEKYKYYYLSIENGVPRIIDIDNPIETLKNLENKPVDINNNQYELEKFLAYKNLAESNIINKMSH